MKTVGFVGVGIMGKSMVRNLMKAGFTVQIYSRTKAKVEDVLAEGAKWCDSPAACAAGAEAVFSIVGYPKDVEEVYFGENGILSAAAPGSCIVDMTTSSPALARRIYDAAKEKGVFALDAPVTGGDTGARNGTLAILVGGDKEAFEMCLPAFEAMGKDISHMGGPGMGQHTKMANQIVIAGSIAGCVEAMAYSKRVGLDPIAMHRAIGGGAAGGFQLNNVAARILKNDLDPGFFIKHFVKDMNIAVEEAEQTETELPVLKLVLDMYKELMAEGYSELGTQGLVKHYDKDEKFIG